MYSILFLKSTSKEASFAEISELKTPLLLLLLSCFSRVRLCVTPWTAAYQASPSMGFFRQEHWSGLPLPSCKTPLVDRYSCTVAINETQIPELHVLPIIELFPQYCMHLSFKIYFLTAVAISLVFPVNLTWDVVFGISVDLKIFYVTLVLDRATAQNILQWRRLQICDEGRLS